MYRKNICGYNDLDDIFLCFTGTIIEALDDSQLTIILDLETERELRTRAHRGQER